MDTVVTIVQQQVKAYTGQGLNGTSYLVADPEAHAWTVISVGYIEGERFASADLIVRMIGEVVVIERDDNDPPLVDALIAAGIPRTQIVLAYAGEPVPESV